MAHWFRLPGFTLLALTLLIFRPTAPCAENGSIPSGIKVGEKLTFQGRWFGIPVGTGSLEVAEIVEINGRRAYHVVAEGRTNDVLSKVYPIHDILHSYIDVETLQPLRFEKDQKEGHYRAKEEVQFDAAGRKAEYRSLLNNSTKSVELTEEFQDLISAFYWLRRQPLEPNKSIEVNIYSDEKIYRTEIRVRGVECLELLKRGTFSVFRLEPKPSFKGVLVKRGRIWAYLTDDPYRLPLLLKASTPWGAMSAVLDENSIPEDVESDDACGRTTRP